MSSVGVHNGRADGAAGGASASERCERGRATNSRGSSIAWRRRSSGRGLFDFSSTASRLGANRALSPRGNARAPCTRPASAPFLADDDIMMRLDPSSSSAMSSAANRRTADRANEERKKRRTRPTAGRSSARSLRFRPRGRRAGRAAPSRARRAGGASAQRRRGPRAAAPRAAPRPRSVRREDHRSLVLTDQRAIGVTLTLVGRAKKKKKDGARSHLRVAPTRRALRRHLGAQRGRARRDLTAREVRDACRARRGAVGAARD